MSDTRYDVLGIGNAIVDVLTESTDAFLRSRAMTKGTMALIDAELAEALYAELDHPTHCSGGSAANTMAGIASLGGRAAFVGKVRNDTLGDVFRDDIRGIGVDYDTPSAADGPATGRCLVFVTPDAQRTMQTYLGAAGNLGPPDIDPDTISASAVTYMEGYMWDPPGGKRAFLDACRIAHESRRRVALSLSDAFCVERHRDEFIELVSGPVDLLFANEIEIAALTRAETFDDAIRDVRGTCEIAVVTRGEHGAVVVTRDDTLEIAASPVDRVVDTTGAGDLFAAGFLHAWARGHGLDTAARIGCLSAAEVIRHYGARPETRLAAIADPILENA